MNDTLKKKQQAEEFYKLAFCVDGYARIIHDKDFKIEGVVKLVDSKRGTFYIATVKKRGV